MTEPRPVVLILSSLGAGGAEGVIAMLANHLVERGEHVVIVAFDSPADPIFHALNARVELVRLALPPVAGGPAAALRLIARVAALRRCLRRLRPTVVISFLLKINIVALGASRGLGIPVIVSERNHPVRGTGSRAWRIARERLYPAAAAVVLQTEASRETLSPRIADRSVVIPNPVVVRSDGTRPPPSRTLAAVGRLVPQKGFDLLLEAYAKVAAKHRQWRLVIWGEGPLRAELEAQRSRLGLDDRVVMPGVSERPGSWLETSSAFVLSSRYEGFSNATAEAMAAGVPVVAFDCEFGTRELLDNGRAGLLVPAEDCAALAEAIDRLLADDQLRRMLSERARSSSARFASANVLAAWDALLAQITAAPTETPIP